MTYPRYSNHFTPFDTARPVPNAEDRAAGEAFVIQHYDNGDYCPAWLADHRPSLVESAARIKMQKRLEAEHNALKIGEQSASKPLGKFGSASVRKPVSEGIAKANTDDASSLRGLAA